MEWAPVPLTNSPDERSGAHRARATTPATAAWATFGVFAAAGMLLSSWVSRIPSVREALHVDPAQLGLVLLSASVGAVLALPTAGPIVGRLGPALTVRLAATLACAGMAVVSLATTGPIALLAAGLFLIGGGIGIWDVAMNLEGAAVERELGRSIMPRFHAGYSVGTVAGALVGAGVEAAGVSPRVHLLAVAVVLAVLVPLMTRYYLPVPARSLAELHTSPDSPRKSRSAWRERRTVLIGLFVLTVAFTEGSANDWLAVATVSGYHQSASFGSLMFGDFVAAMTVGRFASTRLLDRFGRVPVLRVGCVVAATGVACVVLGPSLAFVVVGAALWGFGASAGFPVGISAAADDPARGHARVGTVASIAYTAFLAGPPLVGFLGNHFGVRHALAVTGVIALVGLMLAGRTAPEELERRSAEPVTAPPVAGHPAG
ncbi:MAG: major facilitator superfamily 1 [Acidimicrobiaceae bacterium]|nr:major facilitator superfamily 1 [Acidimicrobiaceae bacterium]